VVDCAPQSGPLPARTSCVALLFISVLWLQGPVTLSVLLAGRVSTPPLCCTGEARCLSASRQLGAAGQQRQQLCWFLSPQAAHECAVLRKQAAVCLLAQWAVRGYCGAEGGVHIHCYGRRGWLRGCTGTPAHWQGCPCCAYCHIPVFMVVLQGPQLQDTHYHLLQ
jgi:hypothetical protein